MEGKRSRLRQALPRFGGVRTQYNPPWTGCRYSLREIRAVNEQTPLGSREKLCPGKDSLGGDISYEFPRKSKGKSQQWRPWGGRQANP